MRAARRNYEMCIGTRAEKCILSLPPHPTPIHRNVCKSECVHCYFCYVAVSGSKVALLASVTGECAMECAMEKKEKRRGQKDKKTGASAATRRWRKALRAGPCRDRSPLPESVPTPYKRIRAHDEREDTLKDLENRREETRYKGREKKFTRPPMQKMKTKIKITAEDLNKLFYERDILKDKLRRRNEELERAGVGRA